ncbi:MarR family winged helix-turn-helix transcriptional regulator [Fluviicola sp.]|uniref:MarR family winged helix-turn-helix transcriptional regulator n=1 Tax=Fluviicola sp. TaxID=1917219 RepID=UPI003D2E9233
MMEVENTNMAKLVELIDSIREMRFVIQNYFKKQLKDNELGITVEMLEVLMVLSKSQQINQQQIADRIRKNKANLTPIITKLSVKNLVQRQEDCIDRRNNLISLTDKGQTLCTMYVKLFEEFYCEFLKDVDIKNLNKTITILKKIGQEVSKSS